MTRWILVPGRPMVVIAQSLEDGEPPPVGHPEAAAMRRYELRAEVDGQVLRVPTRDRGAGSEAFNYEIRSASGGVELELERGLMINGGGTPCGHWALFRPSRLVRERR